MGDFLEGLVFMAYAGAIAIILSIAVGTYSLYDYFFIDDYVTISKSLEPVEITITDTDTLYTYKISD